MFFSLFLTFLPSIFSSSSSSSSLSTSSTLKITPELSHEEEITYLHSLSSTIHNITSIIQKKHSKNPSLSIVCLSTGVHTYGGLGNFVGSLITATVLSLMNERVLVINNFVFTSMFIHPDKDNTFISFPVTPGTRMFAPGECQIKEPSKNPSVQILGVNRCDRFLVHDSQVLSWFSNTFHVPNTFRATNKPWLLSENRISYDILHWLLSKPSAKWEHHLKEQRTNVYKNCSRDGWEHARANLAIQVRTFADIFKDPISKKRYDCYVNCALKRAKELHELHQHSVCVLVTSDNSQLTDLIINKLNEESFITAVHNDYPISSTISHSGDLLLKERDNAKFTIENLHNHPEFIDWMLLSDSESAIYTVESTFAATARYRAGFIKAQNDMVVRMVDKENCVCDAVVEKK